MTIEKAAQNLTANKELRLHDLRCAMHKIGASAALISSDESVFWLTGYSGGEAEVIVTPDDALLMTDGRYIEKAKNESAVPAADIMPAKRASVLKAYFEESLLQKTCCEDDCENTHGFMPPALFCWTQHTIRFCFAVQVVSGRFCRYALGMF